jgi:hypothetical protein
MSLPDEIAGLLPTKSARLAALATLTAAPPSFLLPHFVSPLLPQSTQAEIVLAQILLPTLIGLVGSLTVLLLVLIHLRQVEKAASQAPAPATVTRQPRAIRPNIDERAIPVLRFVCKNDRCISPRISSATKLDEQLVEYLLGELSRLEYVYSVWPAMGAPMWSILHDGRAELVRRGLL